MAKRLPLAARPARMRGALAVEAAYVLPVVIAAVMMLIELIHVGLTINMGSSALDRALTQMRQDSGVGHTSANGLDAQLRQRMAAASHHYLTEDNIATVDIEHFVNLDALGGGTATKQAASKGQGGANQSGSGDDRALAAAAQTDLPAWRIAVDIRKEFITPLPRLLGIDSNAFRYRYEQVLSYLPAEVQ